MIDPELTCWPPWRLTPSLLPALSRPFFPAPPAFLWAMAYSFVAFLVLAGAGFLTVFGLAASFLAGLALAAALAGFAAAGASAGAAGFGAGAGFSTGASFSSARSSAVIVVRSGVIRVMRTLVSCCLWPRVRRYCFLLFCLKRRTFSSLKFFS